MTAKVRHAKSQIRTDQSPDAWGAQRYCERSLWHKIHDTVPRIQYAQTSAQEFRRNYEWPDLPVVIQGVADDWSANQNWEPEEFYKRYKEQKFKVGEDDDGGTVYMRYKHFHRYCQEMALQEDSPLYIFDSSFPRRKGKTPGEWPLRALLDDYKVPKYFEEDLFKYMSAYRRPPFRWIVMGPERSGTGIHLDPLGTSAWNTLLVGHKRWCLFPPNSPQNLVNPPRRAVYYDARDLRYGIRRVSHVVRDREAATWFNEVYPNLAPWRDMLEMVEIVQKPGETVFVPGGWWHVVINLTYTVAVTQNFCSLPNLERVYLQARRGRPKMCARWVANLMEEAKRRGVDVSTAAGDDSARPDPDSDPWAFIAHTIKCLETVPQIPGSSSSSGSSSTTDSGADSEAECM
ncbi:hypothetical protein BC828DRAFT_345964 [Blastocladiella britannica]|nr:hypothetical protein BC828DRAFT_345964 [Blastocladiella britannica]